MHTPPCESAFEPARPSRWPALILAAAALLPTAAPAAPHVPARDDEVVQQLPTRLATEVRTQRRQLQADPANLGLALQTARAAIVRARASGDPREFGQARAALAPWWGQPDPPPAVRLLRATLRQSEHHFEPALRDLDALIGQGAAAPLQLRAQAELTRASVLQVQGRYADAAAGCERLAAGPTYAPLGDAVRHPANACLAELKSLRGDMQAGEAALAALADEPALASAGWLALVRAELAERRGDPAAAQTHYRSALASQPDVYTLAAYADWLIGQQRHAEVVDLLADREEVDALLLRKAIALRRQDDRRADAAVAALQSRFDAARQRGDVTHAREEARFELDLRDRPERALNLAQANWERQKEPADGWLLVRAAHAAGQPAAAEPVRRFAAANGLADVRLAAYAPTTPVTP